MDSEERGERDSRKGGKGERIVASRRFIYYQIQERFDPCQLQKNNKRNTEGSPKSSGGVQPEQIRLGVATKAGKGGGGRGRERERAVVFVARATNLGVKVYSPTPWLPRCNDAQLFLG
jgi:hypothetical protein